MIWWADLPRRALAERAAISDLADQKNWLQDVAWTVDSDLQLYVTFVLQVGERRIPLTLRYPEFFPDSAPSVIPKDDVRLSQHQYGSAGELCLQYRPDNWSADITGAMMIESAYRLLSSEEETGEPAVSDHRIQPAQRARSSTLRFIYSPETFTALSDIEVGVVAEAEIREHCYAGVFAAQLERIGSAEAPQWVEINKRGHGSTPLTSKVVRLPDGSATHCTTVEGLAVLLEQHGFQPLAAELLQERTTVGLILFDGENIFVPMLMGEVGSRTLLNYSVIAAEPGHERLGPEYVQLKESKVAIIGCGSVGSKVAVHLARSGVGHFVLVDGDILTSGNLVRNELDWRSVGMHKSPALATRLQEVNNSCSAISRTTILGGQESGGSTSITLRSIADCDLIIDATAEPSVFNLCSSIARRAQKPICWAQVFGGGAGGIVVRLRPGIDPTPLTARQRLEAWYAEQGVAWPEDGRAEAYAEIGSDGEPLIADDADVSVIAAHLARFALDLLTRPGATAFPYSAYLIGMSDRWLFREPFDVRPIDLGESDGWQTLAREGDTEALKQLIAELRPGAKDAG